MAVPELHLFPILTSLLFPITIVISYTMAVLLGHTEIDWPYISDTGAYPPESCVFAQLMNLGAVLLAIVVYIRYKQVQEFFLSHQIHQRAVRVNQVGLYLGWIGAFGVSVVANFQETQMFRVHFTGAMMAFGIGTLYLWSQVFTSIKLTSLAHGHRLTVFRLLLASTCSVTLVLMLVTGVISRSQFHGKDKTKWYPEDGGWPLHVVSTASEWIMALAFNLFILSFVSEFRNVQLDSPHICLRIRRSQILLVGDNDLDGRDAYTVQPDQDCPASGAQS